MMKYKALWKRLISAYSQIQLLCEIRLTAKCFVVVEIIRDFQKVTTLKDEVINLIKPSYVDITALIEREYNNNDTIHTLRNDNGELIAFFMTGNDDIDELRLIYLGLSAVQHDLKNKGLGKLVYLSHISEHVAEQSLTGKKIYCWGTTATPSAFNAVHHIWDAASPDVNYRYSDEAYEISKLICQKHSYKYSLDEPFVLRSVANNTLYSEKEKDRIRKYNEKTGFSLFDRLNIKEENGDRVILVCQVPTQEKLLKLQAD